MGCAPSQPKQQPPSPQKRDFREQLVWERSGRKFCEVYELLKDLNSGSFGTVALCRRKADGNRSIERTPSRTNLQRVKSESVFAMKALDYMRHNGRLRLDEATRNELRHEIDVLRKVDHPSIVHLREAFWEPTRLVLVMEYCEGRELAEFCGQLTESKVYRATEQILRAVSYLHARRVLHRDLKLENVMVTDQQDWHVTIVDFGLSRVFPQSLDGSRTGIKAAGTTSTAAPEVIRGEEYLMVSDVWSIGAMVYRLVGDRDPFLRDDRRDDPKALRCLEAGDCTWGRIATMSRPGRAFVFKCLRPHPGLRWAADAALKYCARAASFDASPREDAGPSTPSPRPATLSPRRYSPVRHRRDPPSGVLMRPAAGLAEWRPAALRPVNIDTNVPETTEKRDKSPRLAPELESSLKRYGSYTELKRAALIIAAAQTDKRSVKKLREEFLKIDTDASGTINEQELCAALGVAELDTPTKDVFAKLDHDRSGEVHYHEFLAATLEAHELLNEEVLQDTFDRMDHDDSGVISRENLRSLLGSRASDELVETLMQDGDLKRNGHVDYEEFSRVMRSGASGSVDSLEDVAPMF